MDEPSTLLFETTEPFVIKHIPIKRIFDISFSSVILVLISPILLFIAFLVSINCKGKIIFSQQRIGRGGKPFQCYKFCTMSPHAEIKLVEILANDPLRRKEWEEKRKLTSDPRVTFIGKFLRKTSLDELPQFWNVIKGDLSIVGPRPVVAEEIQKYFGPKAQKILSIRPGITGPWQVLGRSDLTYSTRISMDEQYVENHSFTQDCWLILKTIPAMIRHRGAY